VCNYSFEHVLQHVELAGLLSTSSKGASAATAARPGFVFTTVQGLLRITNRAGKFFLQRSISFFALALDNQSPRPRIFSRNIFKKIFARRMKKTCV